MGVEPAVGGWCDSKGDTETSSLGRDPHEESVMIGSGNGRVTAVVATCAIVGGLGLSALPQVALAQSRGYFVILGSFPDRGAAAGRMRSRCLASSGHRLRILDSSGVDGFRAGLYVVAVGPYRSQGQAQDVQSDLRGCVRDAYVKYGRDLD